MKQPHQSGKEVDFFNYSKRCIENDCIHSETPLLKDFHSSTQFLSVKKLVGMFLSPRTEFKALGRSLLKQKFEKHQVH